MPSPKRRTPLDTQGHFVLFADMLGFKELVLNHNIPFAESLDFKYRPTPWTSRAVGDFTQHGLAWAFTSFHGGVNETVNSYAWTAPATLIVFSDSLFLASISARDCIECAAYMMHRCIGNQAPIRMGVGYGSFVPYGFAFEQNPHLKILSSQFFGSAVIYAVEAEKHLKGLRIALHQSAVDSLTRSEQSDFLIHRILPLPHDQTSPTVSDEWNYLIPWDDADARSGRLSSQWRDTLRTSVVMMSTASAQNRDTEKVYSATSAALDRMTAAFKKWKKTQTKTRSRAARRL